MTTCAFGIRDGEQVKGKVLNWAKRFNTFCFLDNHHYAIPPHTVESVLAAGVKRKITATAGTALPALQQFMQEKQSWLFGHLGYNLKNEIEQLASSSTDPAGFPDLYFFEPEILVRFAGNEIQIEAPDPEAVYAEITAQQVPAAQPARSYAFSPRIAREEYIDIINKLRKHILRGDCYEINFCQEFFAAQTWIDPLAVYNSLSEISPNPFSALYRLDDKWLLCASPERFLRKTGDILLSQPIKGTSKRFATDPGLDEQSRKTLQHSGKDRSENVMVVDLVRNDLSKLCKEGTVQVDELYGIYSFPQVHQMISTISGRLKEDISFGDIIRATFPMGSMTGAPKKRVLELIDRYERTARGIFSGAVGYISPDGDFDFNVVIRSIMYNAASGYTSFQVGSGITFYSDALQEWEECLLKASAIKQALQLQS